MSNHSLTRQPTVGLMKPEVLFFDQALGESVIGQVVAQSLSLGALSWIACLVLSALL